MILVDIQIGYRQYSRRELASFTRPQQRVRPEVEDRSEHDTEIGYSQGGSYRAAFLLVSL